MRSEIDRRRSALTDDIEAIEDRVRPSRVARRRTEEVRTRFRSAREAVMGRVDDGTGSARDMAGSVSDAPHQLTETARGNPIAAGLVAFGLGLVTATLIPATETERELAQNMAPQLSQAREAITGAVAEDARAIAEQVSPKVQDDLEQMGESVKGSASRVQDEVRG